MNVKDILLIYEYNYWANKRILTASATPSVPGRDISPKYASESRNNYVRSLLRIWGRIHRKSRRRIARGGGDSNVHAINQATLLFVKRKQQAMKHFHLILFSTIILGAILACGYQTVLRFDGYSMEPTITNGQKLITEEISLSDLEQGDIIWFELDERLQAKRLIGFPGEKIEIRDGNIYINDQILIEDYEASSPEYRFGPITLEADQYFVLGDNRDNSKDSHQYGPINGDQIKGRVILIQE